MKSTKDDVKDRLKAYKEKRQAPEWLTWMGLQMLEGGYLVGNESPRQMYMRLAKGAAKYTPKKQQNQFRSQFFEIMWKGWLAPSTPVAANLGTDRGMAVSCSGNYVEDDLSSIYMGLHEQAMLTKSGFGTSSYMGDIRGRGTDITKGGKSSGLIPWIEEHREMTQVVSQAGVRRGSWAGYFPIEHLDFFDIMEYTKVTDKVNIGVNISDNFIERLEAGDKTAVKRYNKLLETRMITGRPYIFFVDRANTLSPPHYQDKKIYASNLCTEIMLHSSKKHTFTCVLSSMNCLKFDEWKDTDAVFIATVFLDCVAEDLIMRGHMTGLEKSIRSTRAGRALGLGLLGFHSYLQSKMIPFDSLPAQYANDIIFSVLQRESLSATMWMGKEWGEPEWCKGTGRRNTHCLAVAPNTSSALICGSTSQGIEPWVGNYYIQTTAKGKVTRINPLFLKLLESKGQNTKEVLDDVAINHGGSCQHLDFLTQDEKDVFRTAFEINQKAVIRLAERRQKFIDQGQSLNLFFTANEDPKWIHEVHKLAFSSSWIKSLYYVRTQAGMRADKGEDCLSCEG